MNTLSGRTWPQGVEFRIVTVVPYSPRPPYAKGAIGDQFKTRQMVNNNGQQFVEAMVAQLKKGIEYAEISGKVLTGGITSSIVEEAEQWKPDLIVMGAHGRNGLQKFIFGSISENVSKQVTCQVEIVKQIDLS